MSEISKYDAQKKKLDGLCEEHDLTFRLRHDRYPITLTIKPLTGMDQQMDMLADAENKDYISQDASMVIYRKDGELATKITGTFTISESLRNKFKNIYVKISDFWLQYFFRDIMEKNLLSKSPIRKKPRTMQRNPNRTRKRSKRIRRSTPSSALTIPAKTPPQMI